jgi:hypothetical protein
VQYTCSVLGPLEAHRLVCGLHTRSLDPVLLHKFVELSQQAPAAVARAATCICITLSRCKQRAASGKQDNACVMTTSNGQVLGSSLLGSLLAVLLQETSQATAIVKPACTHVCPGGRAAQQQLQCSLFRGRIASVKGEKQLEHATGAGIKCSDQACCNTCTCTHTRSAECVGYCSTLPRLIVTNKRNSVCSCACHSQPLSGARLLPWLAAGTKTLVKHAGPGQLLRHCRPAAAAQESNMADTASPVLAPAAGPTKSGSAFQTSTTSRCGRWVLVRAVMATFSAGAVTYQMAGLQIRASADWPVQHYFVRTAADCPVWPIHQQR